MSRTTASEHANSAQGRVANVPVPHRVHPMTGMGCGELPVLSTVARRRRGPGGVWAGCAWQGRPMCRNIRVLYNFEPPATPDEIEAAAIQYVRKVSGSTRPSASNQAAFDAAVTAVAEATRSLLEAMVI